MAKLGEDLKRPTFWCPDPKPNPNPNLTQTPIPTPISNPNPNTEPKPRTRNPHPHSPVRMAKLGEDLKRPTFWCPGCLSGTKAKATPWTIAKKRPRNPLDSNQCVPHAIVHMSPHILHACAHMHIYAHMDTHMDTHT